MESSDGLKWLLENSLSTTNSTTFLSRNYVVQQYPSCNVMEKIDRSGEVSEWESLPRDILVIIFDKLDIMDLTMVASRVCISWFLASHTKSLWSTIDLSKLQQVEFSYFSKFSDHRVRPVILYKYRVDLEVAEGLSLRNLVIKISKFFFDFDFSVFRLTLMELLDEITKLSRMAPKNLFFHFNSYIETEDLMFAAERMPNIEKLVLPVWCYRTEKSFQFAFSQWKNLTTLIIAQDFNLRTGTFDYQTVGENCKNLTNFKYLGHLQEYNAEQIALYLQNLKMLSLRCSLLESREVVLSLITGLQNLTILNLSHCIYLDMNPDTEPDDYFVQAPTQKLEKFITCTQDCRICKYQRRYSWSYLSKDWQNDEIKEFEF